MRTNRIKRLRKSRPRELTEYGKKRKLNLTQKRKQCCKYQKDRFVDDYVNN